jgi:hypothetical protein
MTQARRAFPALRAFHNRGRNMLWRDAVLEALRRLSNRRHTRLITRQELIDEELAHIVEATASQGATPGQTMSRVLQELQDEGLLYFTGVGEYLLLDTPVDVETEDLPGDAVDFAIKQGKLHLGYVPTDDVQTTARRRLGQTRVRHLTLQSYSLQCAFCDLRDDGLLVASHIARWADAPEARGILSNVICLCRIHDPLFENGYLSLSDAYQVLKRSKIESQMVGIILRATDRFRLPMSNPPAAEFLRSHRIRTGFEK